MENRRALIAACITAIFGVPLLSFAYSVPTHEGITQVVLQQYEKLHGDAFTSEQETAMIRGSNEEDDDLRYKYHFYDPVNDIGLWGRLRSSKEWVNDQDLQGGSLNSWQGYFDRPEDYTWDRAIYEYVHGDKTRAAGSLGHVLHLIEDSSVPAHVRDDAHGNLWGIGDPDTYEKYTGIFTNGNVNIVGRIIPKTFRTLTEAFDATARFTNENFVSDDTVFAEYVFPKKSDLIVRNGYGYHPKSGHRVASAKQVYDKTIGTTSTEFKFEKSDPSIVNDYWNLLSRHAVESGIGVIDLFFREVEKEKQTGALKEKNLSPLKQHNKKLASGFSLLKALYGSSLNQSDVNELLSDTNGQAGAAALAVIAQPKSEPAVTSPLAPEPQRSAVPDLPSEPVREAQISVNTGATTTEELAEPAQPSAEPQPLYQELVPVTPGFGGGGGGNGPSQQEEPEEEPTETPAEDTDLAEDADEEPVVVDDSQLVTLTIISPLANSFHATTTLVFTGTTEAHGLLNLESGTSTATTTADASGNWSAQLLLEEGDSTVTIQATDNLGERATSTSFSIYTDVTPPSLPSISLPQCANSLAVGFCLLPTASVSVVWADVSDATYYAVAVNGTLGATTTATSSIENVSFAATSSVSVIAYDLAGNASTSTIESLYAVERPVIINEVAWAGTDATATDEWIELKNVSIFQIDLSHITLNIDDSSIALNGVLDAGDMYLIEDRAEATSATHDMVADIELPDTGARLSLVSGEATLDSTPEIATCSGWCTGSATAIVGTSAQHGDLTAKLTMERTAPDADGALASSWHNNDTYIRTSASKVADTAAGVVYGTPALQNSSNLPSAGWDCGDGTLSSAGGAYNPTSSACTYLSAFVNTAANRYGDVYKGTVGSSTLVAGHLLSKSIQSSQNDEGLTNGAIAGDQFFVAIFETRTGPAFNTDLTDFRNYFITGVGTTPHSNYVTIPWTYAP